MQAHFTTVTFMADNKHLNAELFYLLVPPLNVYN